MAEVSKGQVPVEVVVSREHLVRARDPPPHLAQTTDIQDRQSLRNKRTGALHNPVLGYTGWHVCWT